MVNLQLIDTFEGGHFVFERNDYILDEGIYSEVYACLFGTSSPEWWGDTAFDVQSERIASRTEKALKTHNFNTEEDINLIKKAVNDDLARLVSKNPGIVIESSGVMVLGNRVIGIMIILGGNSQTFNFIYQKTKESLDNIAFKVYCDEGEVRTYVTASSDTVKASSNTVAASGGRI